MQWEGVIQWAAMVYGDFRGFQHCKFDTPPTKVSKALSPAATFKGCQLHQPKYRSPFLFLHLSLTPDIHKSCALLWLKGARPGSLPGVAGLSSVHAVLEEPKEQQGFCFTSLMSPNRQKYGWQ